MKRICVVFSFLILFLFAFGCSKNTGWKAQSSPAVSSSNSEEQSTAKPTSFTVSSFLHDLFGGELPKDTDRVNLPAVGEAREYDIPVTAFEGCAFGSSFYYLDSEDKRVFRLDLETGETSVFTDEVKNPRLVGTDTDGVYVYDMSAKEIAYFSFDGERIASVPIPVDPHGGNSYSDVFYAVSLEHYDGLLLLAVRDGVWTLSDGDTEWKMAECELLNGEYVDQAAIRSRRRLVISVQNPKSGAERRLETDISGKNAKEFPGTYSSTNALSVNQGKLWRVTSTTGCRLYEAEEGGESFVQMLTGEGHAFPVVNRVAVSGETVLVFWYLSGRVTLLPMNTTESVRIIAPTNRQEAVDTMMLASTETPVQYSIYDSESFLEKLNLALLSGSDEFDIALVSGADSDTLLRAILKNKLYVDLDENEELRAHIGEMFPGASNLIGTDGQAAFLPLYMPFSIYGFDEAAQQSGIPLPSGKWSLAEFKAFGDSLAGTGYSLFPDGSYGDMNFVLRDGGFISGLAQAVITGTTDPLGDTPNPETQDALIELFSMFQTWRDNGTLFGANPMIRETAFLVFGTPGMMESTEKSNLILLPGVDGGGMPARIADYLIVNPNSPHREQALELLAELTDAQNRYNYRIFQMPLWPGLMEYGYPDVSASGSAAGKTPAIPQQYEGYAAKMDEFLPDYYENSKLCFIYFSDEVGHAITDFEDGKISGEECAKIFYGEYVYKLKG